MENTPLDMLNEALKEYNLKKQKIIADAFRFKGIPIDDNFNEKFVFSIVHDEWECYFAGATEKLIIAMKAWDNKITDIDLENGKAEFTLPPLTSMIDFTPEFEKAVYDSLKTLKNRNL
jgi:hypothetical protein